MGHHLRLELRHFVVNPGGMSGGQGINTRPVRGPTGITPAYDACQVPAACHWAGKWAPRVTLEENPHTSFQVDPRPPTIQAKPPQPSSPKTHLSSPFTRTPCIYLAGVLTPFHVASTQHILIDWVGLPGLGIDIGYRQLQVSRLISGTSSCCSGRGFGRLHCGGERCLPRVS